VQPPSDAPPEPPSEGIATAGTTAYRLTLFVLVAALVGLVALRVSTRRIDPARTPLRPDILVLHLAGLRADSIDVEVLRDELGIAADRSVAFTNAFAPSNNGTRSALSVLGGTLWLDMDQAPGADALPARLRAAGWRTLLVDDEGEVAGVAGEEFDSVARVGGPELQAAAIRTFWNSGSGPRFVFVHVGSGDDPLHADTTESYVLRERYRLRLRALRMAAKSAAEAATDPNPRPQLLAVVGASGLELGEHPGAPNVPYDSQLRVPFLFGLKNARGLPAKDHAVLVQTPDLTPTILDMLDLRSSDERATDGERRTSVSLEPYLHGWVPDVPHKALYFAAGRHGAVRTDAWKLIAPLQSPWLPRAEGAELYSLAEDPAEVHDLLDGRAMGPTAKRLFGDLGVRLNRVDGRRSSTP
jgi:hypothetical protein